MPVAPQLRKPVVCIGGEPCAATVEPAAAMPPCDTLTGSPGCVLRRLRDTKMRRTQRDSHARKVRSLAKKVLGSTRVRTSPAPSCNRATLAVVRKKNRALATRPVAARGPGERVCMVS